MKKKNKRLFSTVRRPIHLHPVKVCNRTHLASPGVEIFRRTFSIALKPFGVSAPSERPPIQ